MTSIIDHMESVWYCKYRPTTIDGYIFNNDQHKNSFNQYIHTKSIPHLLLSGGAGIGKTTISKILINSCIDEDCQDLDVLKLNASDTNSVDDIRTKVYGHITSSSLSKFKIVWLEEAEYLSPNAQGILRDYMEEYENQCRFIITTNQVHKIMEPIRSRCQKFFFKSSDECDIMILVAEILAAEKIKFNIDGLKKHIKIHFPDIRSIINSVEQHSGTGELLDPVSSNSVIDVKSNLISYLENDKWVDLRKHIQTSVVDEELEEIYEFLYNNIEVSPKISKSSEMWEHAIIIIAEHLCKHIQSSKPGINMASCLIQIKHLLDS